MRIAVVGLAAPFRGGIAHYTARLCQALAVGHTVVLFGLKKQYPHFLFPGTSQLDLASSWSPSFPYEQILVPWSPVTWWRSWQRLRAFQPDFILFCCWHPFFAPAFGTLARLAFGLGEIPSVILCHNVRPHESHFWDGLLLRYLYTSGRGFIVHANVERDRLRVWSGDHPVGVYPHPVYDHFAVSGLEGDRRMIRAQLGLSESHVVLFFGYVRAYKGLGVLLDALLDPRLEMAIHLLLVGEFYDDPALYQRQLKALTAQGRLTLVDRYVADSEVGRWFMAADLLVVPYLSASQSGVVQIARAFGLPVIASRVGGLPEVVRHGVDGWLVSPGDGEALMQALKYHFGGGGQRLEVDSFQVASWEGMVKTIENLVPYLK
ncbi:MAG: glycosyltransferase [Magnetococcus sp. DMHC-6]